MHYPPVKATTIWAATRCATVSRSLPTDCPSWEHKSVLLNYSNLLHTGQHSTLPTLTMHLTQHYESDRILMAHVRARVTCLQLSVWGKCGSLHGQLERENTCCAVLFWLFLQNTCLVFLDQHIILIPTGTYFDTHFHTHTHTHTHTHIYTLRVTACSGLRTSTRLPIAASRYGRSIPRRTMYLFSYQRATQHHLCSTTGCYQLTWHHSSTFCR